MKFRKGEAAGEVAPPPGGGVEKKRRAILRGDIEERLQEGEDTPESYHGERWLAVASKKGAVLTDFRPI